MATKARTDEVGGLETFSRVAADWIRLHRALYGPEYAKALIMRCFRRQPKSAKINERTVLNAWQEQDDAIDSALGFDPKTERAERDAAFLAMCEERRRA